MHPFRYYVRVRYQDCDSQHVVFNARYGDYFDLAITEFLSATNPSRDPWNNNFEIQVKKQTIEWFQPARFQDALEIEVYTTRFGRTSFDVRFDMRRAGEPDILVQANIVYVHVIDQAGVWRSAAIPEAERALLEAGAKGRVVDHAGYYPIVLPKAGK
jgi:acyl-CoA thioester hydrolase